MQVKDYYGILELPASASLDEIKRSYRRLALQYHPDTNQQNPYAAAQFAEIKEAYEVLTNPAKKEYYLQQRWYNQSIGKKRTQPVINPVNILKQSLELEKYVSRLDHFRMDKQGLHDYIEEIISDETLTQLARFDEPATKDQIIYTLLLCMKPLPYRLTTDLCERLQKLEFTTASEERIVPFMRSKKKTDQYERYKIWIILLLVIGICLFIFLISKL